MKKIFRASLLVFISGVWIFSGDPMVNSSRAYAGFYNDKGEFIGDIDSSVINIYTCERQRWRQFSGNVDSAPTAAFAQADKPPASGAAPVIVATDIPDKKPLLPSLDDLAAKRRDKARECCGCDSYADAQALRNEILILLKEQPRLLDDILYMSSQLQHEHYCRTAIASAINITGTYLRDAGETQLAAHFQLTASNFADAQTFDALRSGVAALDGSGGIAPPQGGGAPAGLISTLVSPH